MKQTKKKSQKSENKQPIKVQLTKDDLTELLVVVKDFMQEVIQGELQIQNHLLDYHNDRLISLEVKERRREIRRISYCPHKIFAFKSAQYIEKSFRLSAITYKCKNCGMEWSKLLCFLTRKEKKALRLLGVITK